MFRRTQEDDNIVCALDFKQFYPWISTWFGCGLLRPGPGTFGSLGALPFGVLIFAWFGNGALLLAIIVMTILGYQAAQKFERAMGTHDCKMIVVDEVCGQWIALLAAGLNLKLILLAFVFFRLFDIFNPAL